MARFFINFGELAMLWKIAKFRTHQYYFIHYVEGLVIVKFKICQYILITDLPNLMLTKVSRYTVCQLMHAFVFLPVFFYV